MASHDTIIALDVGTKRVGVAKAYLETRLPTPLVTLPNNEEIWSGLAKICEEQGASEIVIGLPRNLSGQDTKQTEHARQFGAEAEKRLQKTIHFQDEAVTSTQAELELATRGKHFSKEDIDALAATYILEDYLNEVHG